MTRDQIANYLSRRSAEEVEKQAADMLVQDAHALATLQAELAGLKRALLRDGEEIDRLRYTVESFAAVDSARRQECESLRAERDLLREALDHVHENLSWDGDRERWMLKSTFAVSTVEVALRSRHDG